MKSLLKLTFVLLCLVPLDSSSQEQPAFQVTITGAGTPILLFPGFTATDAPAS